MTEMKGRLTAIQLEYVLDHIGHHAELHDELRQMIRYGEQAVTDKPSIHFPASEAELDLEKVIRIDDIPVLYPLDGRSDSYFGFDGLCLCFHHDLLKSIFHLLSGYEEVKNRARIVNGPMPANNHRRFIFFKSFFNSVVKVFS